MFIQYLASILGSSWLEQTAAVIALTGILLTVMQRSVSWILDIISSLLYLFVFFNAGFYSDSLLQILFIGMSIYGWYSWTKTAGNGHTLQIRNIKQEEITIALLVIILLTLTGGFIFSRYAQGASYPYADSFCTSLSVAATWLTARKIIQNWYLWIFADLLYICLFFLKQLYPSAILYSVLVILAIAGLTTWKKIEKQLA